MIKSDSRKAPTTFVSHFPSTRKCNCIIAQAWMCIISRKKKHDFIQQKKALKECEKTEKRTL